MGWTYLTDTDWNANSWANNRTGAAKAQGSQQWYGGNFGGPVYIPKIYNGRNKTFFFASYEYTVPTIERDIQAKVLTEAERRGDFSNSLFGIPKINGIPTPQLAPSMFSPLAKALLADTSLLPTSSDPKGVYTWKAKQSDEVKPLLIKIDQSIGTRQRLFVTLFAERYPRQMDSIEASNLSTYNQLPNEGTATHQKKFQNWTLNHTFTLTPTMLNNFVLGVKRNTRAIQHNPNPALSWDKLGMSGVKADNSAFLDQVVVQVGSGVNGFTMFGGYDDAMTENINYFTDGFSWVKGRHTIQFGGDFRAHEETKLQNWYAAGSYTFSSSNLGSTGNVYADFLLGTGAAFSQTSLLDLQLKYPGTQLYFQDQVKVSRKLTATLGVRWEPYFGPRDPRGQLSAFRAGQQSTAFPNAPAGMVVPGDAGVSLSTYPDRWGNLAPRVGFAYDVKGNGKMSIRAGYEYLS